jgi:hypothetical protein
MAVIKGLCDLSHVISRRRLLGNEMTAHKAVGVPFWFSVSTWAIGLSRKRNS